MNGKVAITGGLVFLGGLSYMLSSLYPGFIVELIGAVTILVGLVRK